MDGGAWWATVHGVTKSRTRLSDLTFTLQCTYIYSTWCVYVYSVYIYTHTHNIYIYRIV